MSVLVLEPFYDGSHKQVADILGSLNHVTIIHPEGGTCNKWHWRMLVSAFVFSTLIPTDSSQYHTIMFTAMMNVTELLGLRPDLKDKRKVLYFHENQLEYPKSHKNAQQDFNLVWNQIISCVSADVILFNSKFNMDSFFLKAGPFVNKIPTIQRPRIDFDSLISKSRVLYCPIALAIRIPQIDPNDQILHIVWPHRWEHDKGTSEFMDLLEKFNSSGLKLKISVLGQSFTSNATEFSKAKDTIDDMEHIQIEHWGRIESADEYHQVLRVAHVVISTANHEFFGIGMVEAAFCGCFPIAPKRLSYPELFPQECLYATDKQLYKAVKQLTPIIARRRMQADHWQLRLERFAWNNSARERWLEELPVSLQKRKFMA